MIDLRSDTITRPTPDMLEAMFHAEVGDDVLGDDPTVALLEEQTALKFGTEAALFCPSGTMTNQIAIRVHTRPGDQVICSSLAHIYRYEGGGIAMNSGASVALLGDQRGFFTAQEAEACIQPDDPHHPHTRLLAVEDTCNKGGGSIWSFEELQKLSQLAREHGLAFHLDGARVWNRLVARGDDWKEYASLFDSISVCLSKGLGAPVGSLLLGDAAFIHRARRARKAFGGGMRQAGYLAAAGLYALEHHVERLAEDHRRARAIGEALEHSEKIDEVLPVETNIVIARTCKDIKAKEYLERLREKNVQIISMGPHTIRFVTHLDFDDELLVQTNHAIQSI